jgi:hypothetical protein
MRRLQLKLALGGLSVSLRPSRNILIVGALVDFICGEIPHKSDKEIHTAICPPSE